MKLQLKHLTPYANYGLTGLFLGKFDIVTAIDFEHKIISSLNNGNVLINGFKPILKALSDLTKEIAKCPEGEFIIDGERIREWYDLDPTRCNYEQTTYLFKNHYDVFGLIKKNLAIDKNTL